jgi:hypothetical protein
LSDSTRHLFFNKYLIIIPYVKIDLLAPQLAPHLAGKIVFASACDKG